MRRVTKHVVTRRPYAVDLGTWQRVSPVQHPRYQKIDAIWFRRKSGSMTAHFGKLWDFSDATDAESFLRMHDDGRYGGDWVAASTGQHFWTKQPLPRAEAARIDSLLTAALDRFLRDQSLPSGYDGWWVFR